MRAAVDARRRAGLQAADGKPEVAQLAREPDRRRIACAAARVVHLADVDLAVEERADREHDRLGAAMRMPACVTTPRTSRTVEQQVVDVLLQQREIRLRVEQLADRRAYRARGRPARAWRAPLDLCSRSRSGSGCRRGRSRAPWRRRARRSLSSDGPCRCRRSRDCSSSAPAFRGSASAAACARPCAPRRARPRCRRGRRRRRCSRSESDSPSEGVSSGPILGLAARGWPGFAA